MTDTGKKVQVKPQGKRRGRPRVHPAGRRPSSSRCVVYIGKSMELWQQFKLDGNFRNDSEFASYLLQLYQTSRSNKSIITNHVPEDTTTKASKGRGSAAKLRGQPSEEDAGKIETSQQTSIGSRPKRAQKRREDAMMVCNVAQSDAVSGKTEINSGDDSSKFEVGNKSAKEGNALENAMIRALQQQSDGCSSHSVQICDEVGKDMQPRNEDEVQWRSCSSIIEKNVCSVQRSDCLGSGLNILPKKRPFVDDKTAFPDQKLQYKSVMGAEKVDEPQGSNEEEEHDSCALLSEQQCQQPTLDVSSKTKWEENERVEEEQGEDEYDLEEEMSDKNSDTSAEWTPQSKSVTTNGRNGNQKCGMCGMSFPSMFRMGKHMKSVHGISKPFACDLCKNVSFSSKGNLDSHTFHIHTAERKYVCDVCNAAFKLPRHLQRHMIVHSEERPFKCGVCNKGFKHREAVKLHERKHSGKKPYLCAQCGAQFAIESSLRSHMVVHTEDRPYVCKDCNARFKTSATLRMHREVHIEGSTHLCAVCGEQFKTARALRSHTRRHGDKPHQCSDCGNRFAILGELNRHVKVTHSANKPHVCEICGFRFKLKNYLSTHMARMHSGDRRPHKCMVCRATFKMPLDLKHHMRKHSDLRPFPCDLCDWKFKTKTHLKQHMDIIHGKGGRVKCFARRTIRSTNTSNVRGEETGAFATPHQLNKNTCQEITEDNDTNAVIESTGTINISPAVHNIPATERTRPITIRTDVLLNGTEMDQSIQKGDVTLSSALSQTLDQSILTAPPLAQPMEQLTVDQVTPQSPVFRDTGWSDALSSSLIQSGPDLDLTMTRPRWPPCQPMSYMFQRQTYYNTDQSSNGYVMGNSETV